MNGSADQRPVRLMLVDDDEWVRRGRADALRERAEVEVIGALGPAQAIAYGEGWADCDVAIVDAAEEDDEAWDQFPGVAVVRAIREHSGKDRTRIIVASGHLLNNLLRLRMADAGADYFFAQRELRTVEQLLAVALYPDAGQEGHTLTRFRAPELIDAGFRSEVDLEAGLAFAHDTGLGEVLDGFPQKTQPLSRRQLITARRRLARLLGVSSSKGHEHLPSWEQLGRVLNRARGHDGTSRSG